MRILTARVYVAAGLLLASGAARAADLTQADLFDDRVVHEIRLSLYPSDWTQLKINFRENTYYACELQWRGMLIGDVAIRSRGRGSRSGVKPNLRVDFNRFNGSQTFLGLRAFDLKANNQDASFLKERLAMQLFRRMGLPASREAPARLYVNDEYVGLYSIVEEVNKDFLTRNFNEDTGYLYEWKPLEEGYHFEYLGSDQERYSPVPFDPVTHEKDSRPRPLEAMIRTINQSSDADFPQAVSEYLDLKVFASYVATETFVSEIDGMLGDIYGMNNFDFYRFAGKNLSLFIPWDKDLTFVSPERGIWHHSSENVLMRRALTLPEVRYAYLESLVKSAAMAGGPGGWLEQEVTRGYNQIRNAAYEDPLKLYIENGLQVASSNEIFEGAVQLLGEFARQRRANVLQQVRDAKFQLSDTAPHVAEDGILDAASGTVGVLTPGAEVVLYGQRLADSTATADLGAASATLGGVAVYVNGFAAPILSVSPTQVNFRMPAEIRTETAPITVITNGAVGNTVTVNVSLPPGN